MVEIHAKKRLNIIGAKKVATQDNKYPKNLENLNFGFKFFYTPYLFLVNSKRNILCSKSEIILD